MCSCSEKVLLVEGSRLALVVVWVVNIVECVRRVSEQSLYTGTKVIKQNSPATVAVLITTGAVLKKKARHINSLLSSMLSKQ